MNIEKITPKVGEVYRYSYEFFGKVYTVESRVDSVTLGGSEAIIMVKLSGDCDISYEKGGYWCCDGNKLLSLEKIS
jgi:hypothetical protein